MPDVNEDPADAARRQSAAAEGAGEKPDREREIEAALADAKRRVAGSNGMTEPELRAALAELSAALDAKGLGGEFSGISCEALEFKSITAAKVRVWVHYDDPLSRRPTAQLFDGDDFAGVIANARAWIAAQPGKADAPEVAA